MTCVNIYYKWQIVHECIYRMILVILYTSYLKTTKKQTHKIANAFTLFLF